MRKGWFQSWADTLLANTVKIKPKVFSICNCGIETYSEDKICKVCQIKSRFLKKYGKVHLDFKRNQTTEEILRLVS
jgi:hypothetical protein